MIVVVDDRSLVVDGYKSMLTREGYPVAGFTSQEFNRWVGGARVSELESIIAFVIGSFDERAFVPLAKLAASRTAKIALVERQDLSRTLELFDAGFDDVVRKPVHVRELLKRIAVIRKRQTAEVEVKQEGRLRVYFDGRDPEIDGEVFPLPRRERRILEFLISSEGRRVCRTQIFNAVYGMFDDSIEECVIESHISKLRRKLRGVLGYDPIDSKRYLGYRFGINDELDSVSSDVEFQKLTAA